jgi:DNA helicase-2/ATP-dependent DNA helicase PcrA
MTSTAQARPARLTAEQLLEGLNPPQREAVLHEGGPVLVVAGAGSGKTRVLTRRICYLVSQRRVHPGSILAITFTNKAAAEMRGRVMDLVGNRAKLMWVSTFHSACVRILRSEIGRFNIARTFSIYDDADSKRLMQLVAHDLDLDPKRFPVRAIMNWVSACKNELVDHESAASRARSPMEESFAEAYREYQRRLIRANALDFDDLIMTTVHLFQAFPDLREQYRRRFRHVLVDEYQDTDHAQYVLIRELCAADPNPDPHQVAIEPPELMVVGDSDQSIYAFRGATIRNINDFESDFPGARVILLEQNYRSTQTILSAANAVIMRNENRKPKNLWSDAGDGEQLVGYVADTEHDEAQFVAAEIKRLNDEGGHRYGDAAVFYRTNAQSRTFEEAFIRIGMPYKVVGGVRFYERREVRDAIAYLRAIANRSDDVSLRRILNVPKRGIGDRAEAAVSDLAARESISFGDALRRVDEIPGLASRSANQLKAFAQFLDDHEAMVAEGMPADAILTSVLDRSGYLAELHGSTDPQDETRLENLKELITVAREFVTGVATLTVPEEELDDLGLPGSDAPPEGDLAAALDPEADLAAGAAEPDA